MEPIRIRQALKDLLKRDGAGLDLAHAALLIAREDYGDLEVPFYLKELDRWGALARANIGASRNPHVIIDRLNFTLFDEVGLRGNVDNYYDPRNSYLNEVMDRRIGIPITLSLIYMEVAQRANFPLEGVGLPGHFIISHRNSAVPLYIDPFHRGALLTTVRCQSLVKRTLGEHVLWEPQWLNPIGKIEILCRMLRNLKEVYTQASQPLKTISVLERLLLIQPGHRPDQEEYLKLYAQLYN